MKKESEKKGKITTNDNDLDNYSLDSDKEISIIEVNESMEVSMMLNQSQFIKN